MAQIEILMPKMGESVMEATITNWLKNEGDTIELDEIIVEIATDKVDSEVPSTSAGKLVKKLFNNGDVVKIGEAFAIIETDVNAAVAPSAPVSVPAALADAPAPEIVAQVSKPLESYDNEIKSGEKFYSPLVKNIAKQEGVSQAELDAIAGSGKDGRVTKEDLMAYIQSGRKPAVAVPAPPAAPKIEVKSEPVQASSPAKATTYQEPQRPTVSISGGDEIVQMDRMRKMIADHMVMSKRVSPHVTSYVEADVTNLVMWREKNKDEFFKRTGEKITFTPIIIEAIVNAIKLFPGVNASVDGDNIILRKNINIGMATALPSGNLIVPVIKNADTMNLVGLTKAVNDLANRARNNKLTPDDIAGGTYTVTNVGTFGNVMGTPIINQPQVAIMAVGAIRKKPAVIETEYGDMIGVRQFMFLSHSYDHRVVDGALGGSFVKKVADFLEGFDINRKI